MVVSSKRLLYFFFLMIRRPPRSTLDRSSAASDVYKRQQEELRNKGVKYCIGAYVDIHGVPKGKVVPIAHLEHMAHGSERYTGYALDGLGQEPHDLGFPG